MTKTRKPAPEAITDAELDQASGGVLIGLLLPAVQKVSAPIRATTTFQGGVRVATGDVNGDGSV